GQHGQRARQRAVGRRVAAARGVVARAREGGLELLDALDEPRELRRLVGGDLLFPGGGRGTRERRRRRERQQQDSLEYTHGGASLYEWYAGDTMQEIKEGLLPSWARNLIEHYRGGTMNLFLVHGSVYDLVPLREDSGTK